jgi:hypothetical protein
MICHVMTDRAAAAVGRCAPSSPAGISALVDCLSASPWFAAVQEATDALVAKTWTLMGGNAPPASVPLRLT